MSKVLVSQDIEEKIRLKQITIDGLLPSKTFNEKSPSNNPKLLPLPNPYFSHYFHGTIVRDSLKRRFLIVSTDIINQVTLTSTVLLRTSAPQSITIGELIPHYDTDQWIKTDLGLSVVTLGPLVKDHNGSQPLSYEIDIEEFRSYRSPSLGDFVFGGIYINFRRIPFPEQHNFLLQVRNLSFLPSGDLNYKVYIVEPALIKSSIGTTFYIKSDDQSFSCIGIACKAPMGLIANDVGYIWTLESISAFLKQFP